jgi:hypothetical protein
MSEIAHAPLDLSSEELGLLSELLESERARLVIEIRHTDHRSYREQLRDRLAIVERLEERCRAA